MIFSGKLIPLGRRYLLTRRRMLWATRTLSTNRKGY